MTSRIPGIATLLAVVAAVVVSVTGGSLVALWAVSIWSICILLLGWLPPVLSLASSIIGFFVLELFLLHLGPYVGAGAQPLEWILWGGLGLAVGILRTLRPARSIGFGRLDWWLVLSASAGSIVVVASIAIAQIVPGSFHLGWAMNGDAVNVMGFARRMLANGGIAPASTPQPTPLPFAMVASNMAGGRDSLPDGEVLRHDVVRMAELWIFVIAISCLLVGASIARIVRSLRPALAVPVVLVASLSGLTWYFIGVQFNDGFINSGFAILILLTVWTVYAAGERHPAAALVALILGACVLLAVWSPLVACVAGLAIVMAVRLFRRVAGQGLLATLPIILAFALLVTYGVVFTLPGFLSSSDSLGGDGGFPPIGPASILVIAAVTVGLACLKAAITKQSHLSAGALGLIAAFGLGLAYLLYQRRGTESVWGYYPAKFSWTVSVLLIVIAMGFAATLLVRLPLRSGWGFASVVAVSVVFGSLLWAPGGFGKPELQFPLAGILQGRPGINDDAETVFRLSGADNGNDFLWRSAGGDYWVNYWLLQTDIEDQATNPVKTFAGSLATMSVDQVCSVIGLLGAGAIVHTSDPMAPAELATACAGADYRVVVENT